MLVLSRKSMQKIHIGDSVVVTVLGIRGTRVRIGIDAPTDFHVLRSELCGADCVVEAELARPDPTSGRD